VSAPKLAATVFALLALASGVGCARDDEGSARLELYHLQASWKPPRALTEEPDASEDAHVVTCGPEERYCPGLMTRPKRAHYYVLRGAPALTTADFDRDSFRRTVGPDGSTSIVFEFTPEGARRFRELTRKIAAAGRRTDELHSFAIVVGDRLVSAPTVDYETSPDGIEGGGAEISGMTTEQADALFEELDRG
jgi:preprotein translocase subunit SecD